MGVGIIFTRPQHWNPLKLYWSQSLDQILRTLISAREHSYANPRGLQRARTSADGVDVATCVFFLLLGVMGETQGYPSSHRGRRDVHVGPEIRRVAFSSHGGLDATSEIPSTTRFWHIRVSSVHDAAHRSFHVPLRRRLVLFPPLPRLFLSSSCCAYRFPVCVPPPPPISGETRHFSWDVILIAVLRLKRLLRFVITLRRIHTARIFHSRSEVSILLAKVWPGGRKLICPRHYTGTLD